MNRSRSWIAALAAAALPVVVPAQQSLLPPSAVLTNYDRVLIGQEEALESGAYVARVADNTQSMNADGTPWNQQYFRDPAATFACRLPLTVNVGLAWRDKRFEAEVDVCNHAGFYSDAVPVAPAGSNLFRSVNLYGATTGAKLKGAHLSGSVGLGFSWGDSNDFLLGTPGDPGAVTTRLSIRSVSLLYAIAYTF